MSKLKKENAVKAWRGEEEEEAWRSVLTFSVKFCGLLSEIGSNDGGGLRTRDGYRREVVEVGKGARSVIKVRHVLPHSIEGGGQPRLHLRDVSGIKWSRSTTIASHTATVLPAHAYALHRHRKEEKSLSYSVRRKEERERRAFCLLRQRFLYIYTNTPLYFHSSRNALFLYTEVSGSHHERVMDSLSPPPKVSLYLHKYPSTFP